MKKLYWTICIAIILTLGMNIEKAQASEPAQRTIGLHDKVLPIEQTRVVDGDTKVPFEEISKYLYLTVTEENGKMHIEKRDNHMIVDFAKNTTTTNGVERSGTPFMEIDGKMYISVKEIAYSMGFQIDYFRHLHTIRIYRDDYPHMDRVTYERKIADVKNNRKHATSPSDKVTVYLTFDDGPNKFTLMNNNTLEKYKVPATFFFLGNQMQQNASIVKTIHDSGHYIGSHSMTHDKNLVYQSTESFIAEMAEGAELIKQLTGQTAKLVRVPYGSTPHVTSGMKQSLIQHGYKMWDWNVDSNDWRYTDKQADQIVHNVKEGVNKAIQSGDRTIVILLHDRSQTTIALPAIIQWLQNQGYSFKTYNPNEHISHNFHKEPLL
ncbi:polysaccharide deacetylase family protein [Sporosarcina sp. OR05]|uniref:polysaccharide deacetylase family protein n=1 Tax=Sporosarcina sp. OR05 TaxID=2969819 RepID=UPI00352A19F6